MTNLKKIAAEEAVQHIQDSTKLGLGTGTTARYVLEALAQRLRERSLIDIVGVPTSEQTAAYALELGIPLTTLEDTPHLDLTIDGADEVNPDLDLIKGLGGALLREKIVASASERLFIVVDDSKKVERLGLHAPLPIEVLRFGWTTLVPFLEGCGAQPVLRKRTDRQPFLTDNGHYILDCHFPGGIQDPHALVAMLDARTGIVEHGLFLGMAEAVFVGTEDGVETLGATLAMSLV